MNDLTQDPEFQAELVKRIRQRMLHAMEAGDSATSGERSGRDAAAIVNNIYGSGGGLMGHLGNGGEGSGGAFGTAAPPSPEDYDYLVDIERRDLPEMNPETGKPIGWSKKVRRFRQPHDEKKKY